MNYSKVAVRSELEAEDQSQVAERAIVHLRDAGTLMPTMCGKVDEHDVTPAGNDRVVSCADCLAAFRAVRNGDAPYPVYGGIERRSRPRFIEVDLEQLRADARRNTD